MATQLYETAGGLVVKVINQNQHQVKVMYLADDEIDTLDRADFDLFFRKIKPSDERYMVFG